MHALLFSGHCSWRGAGFLTIYFLWCGVFPWLESQFHFRGWALAFIISFILVLILVLLGLVVIGIFAPAVLAEKMPFIDPPP